MNRDAVWWFASDYRRHRYEATFGKGFSERMYGKKLGWSIEEEAFVIESSVDYRRDITYEKYPCGLRVAHDILNFCLREDVCNHFFSYGDEASEMVVCDDQLVILEYSGSKMSRTRGLFPQRVRGGTSIQFYAPDGSVQRIYFADGFCESLRKLSGQLNAEKILEHLEGRQVRSA